MADSPKTRPDDKTILRTADDAVKDVPESEEHTPPKEFIPYIIIADGPRQGTRFQLKDGDNFIGRSVSSVAMLEDASVSRRHSLINHSRTGWIVKDVGSKNGTFVNGQRVKDPVNIGHGDVIQIGIYAMRLITKPTTSDEELAPLPAEVEGKTIMVSASKGQEEKIGEHGETKTVMEGRPPPDGLTGEFKVAGEGGDLLEEVAKDVEGAAALPKLPQETPEKKKMTFARYLPVAISLLILIAVLAFVYIKFLSGPSKPTKPAVTTPTEPKVTQVTPVKPQAPKTVPVFLDFASSPLPAKITMEGKDYGLAPVKVNLELELGKTYSVQGLFELRELQDTKSVQVTFSVEPDSTSIPILLKGPIGIMKVQNLPRDTQFYLEGYYTDDQFKPHNAKFPEVVFNKPIYIPYGRYIVELRQPKKIGDSNQFVEDIRFKREFNITEENPIFEVSVSEDDLNRFPVDIKSVPDKADVFIDGQLMGQTPYKGDFPLGEHTLVLRKDGYFEHSQGLKMDINMLYAIEVPLKTTVAGQFINAGNLLYNKGLYRDAIAQFSEVFKNSPTEAEIAQTQYLLGMSYLQMGDSATAMGYFEQSRQQPDFKYAAMLGMASIYGAANNMAQALPLLVEVMLKSTDEQVKSDAHGVFRQLSPLRSVMYIYTEPEGATVFVNDKPIQQKTPLILHDLGLGNYKIKIQKDGFIPQDLNINMSIAEFNPVIIKLKPIEQ